MRCPECDERLSPLRPLWFLRLLTFDCPGCGRRLALDRRGRVALIGSVMGAILVAVLLAGRIRTGVTIPVVAIVGVLAGCLVTAWVGRLVVEPEDEVEPDE